VATVDAVRAISARSNVSCPTHQKESDMRTRKPSPTVVISIAALFVALGGTAIAASRFIITSTDQIKPSVLAELRHTAHSSDLEPVLGGAHVVARARSVGAISAGTVSEPATDPVTGGEWMQHPHELNQLTGQVTVTSPKECGAEGGEVTVEAVVPSWETDLEAAYGPHVVMVAAGRPKGAERTFGFEAIGGRSFWQLFEPGKDTARTLTVKAYDDCPVGHYTINSVSIDVVGAH
jgi:hypothetical protein